MSQVYLHWQVGSLPLASPWASLVAQLVKNPPAMQETPVCMDFGFEALVKITQGEDIEQEKQNA